MDRRIILLIVLIIAIKSSYSGRNVEQAEWLLVDANPKIGEFRDNDDYQLSSPNKDIRHPDLQQPSCQLVPIVHLLKHPDCQTKAIASFACSGLCPSYVRTSTFKLRQHERSCSCCQQTGLQEATFTLDCPALNPPYKKIKTYSPVDCLCRTCTDLGKENLRPQELVEALAGDLSTEDRI